LRARLRPDANDFILDDDGFADPRLRMNGACGKYRHNEGRAEIENATTQIHFSTDLFVRYHNASGVPRCGKFNTSGALRTVGLVTARSKHVQCKHRDEPKIPLDQSEKFCNRSHPQMLCTNRYLFRTLLSFEAASLSLGAAFSQLSYLWRHIWL